MYFTVYLNKDDDDEMMMITVLKSWVERGQGGRGAGEGALP